MDITLQHTPLNRRPDRHHLIGIHPFVRLFPNQLPSRLNNRGHPRHSSHQNKFVDLFGCQARILQTGVDRPNRPFP